MLFITEECNPHFAMYINVIDCIILIRNNMEISSFVMWKIFSFDN